MASKQTTIYARIGTSECFEDATDTPVCPEGMILMQGEYPSAGGEWIAQADGSWAQKQATVDEQAQMERSWAQQQLNFTDKYMMSDYPISAEQRQLVLEYRKQLRNPLREAHKHHPKPAWRPLWPSQLKALE